VAHLDLNRLHIAAPDVGNVVQAQLVARAATDRHGLELVNALKLPTHAHLQHVQRRLHRARAFDRVLLAQLGQHLVHVQAQLGQPLLGDFDVELFVLHAKQRHLADVWHAQQLLAHIIGKALDFGVGESLRLQRINHAIDIAKIIVEERALHARGQRKAHVADFFAHQIPRVGHLGGLGRVTDLENHRGLAGLGVAADLVGVRHLLQGALDLVGHLLGHLLRRGPWPGRPHHHDPKGKRRVFILAQLEIGRKAQHHQNDHQITGQRRMHQRPFGEVETLFGYGVCHAGLTSRQRPAGWVPHRAASQ
jgi:hypothetical protein